MYGETLFVCLCKVSRIMNNFLYLLKNNMFKILKYFNKIIYKIDHSSLPRECTLCGNPADFVVKKMGLRAAKMWGSDSCICITARAVWYYLQSAGWGGVPS